MEVVWRAGGRMVVSSGGKQIGGGMGDRRTTELMDLPHSGTPSPFAAHRRTNCLAC